MSNPDSPTAPHADADGARAKAFHLLRKFTSVSFLSVPTRLYRDFVQAYAAQLGPAAQGAAAASPEQVTTAYAAFIARERPSLEAGVERLQERRYFGDRLTSYLWGTFSNPGLGLLHDIGWQARTGRERHHDEIYIHSFLRRLVEMEQGLLFLHRGSDKRVAYALVVEAREFADCLWGMSADRWRVEHDPFFARLGRGGTRQDGSRLFTVDDSGPVEACALALSMLDALAATVGVHAKPMSTPEADGKPRFLAPWNFVALLGSHHADAASPRLPAGRRALAAQAFPADLPPCPPPNADADGEVASGATMPTDGIWEPWLADGRVGCPNYFLHGQVAREYRDEQAVDSQPVRWRLLWADDRYLDGTVPGEEDAHIDAPVPVRRVLAGQPCPRTGHWSSVALGQTVHVLEGQPMPGPRSLRSGLVSWRFEDNAHPRFQPRRPGPRD